MFPHIKNHMRRALFFLSIITLACGGCSKSCAKNTGINDTTLRIGTNPTYPPFESIDKSGKLVGFDIDYGRAIGRVMDRKVVFKEFDFDALILALKNEQVDLIMAGLSITPSRQKEITMVPYQGEGIKKVSFLFWQSAPQNISSFADIAKLTSNGNTTLSVQAGHFLQDFLQGEGIAIKPLGGPPEQILDIKYKKSLAAALDFANAQTLAGLHPQLKIITLDLPQEKWDLGNGIGIKKDRQQLLNDLKEAIEKLKSDGTQKNLETKWLGDDK